MVLYLSKPREYLEEVQGVHEFLFGQRSSTPQLSLLQTLGTTRSLNDRTASEAKREATRFDCVRPWRSTWVEHQRSNDNTTFVIDLSYELEEVRPVTQYSCIISEVILTASALEANHLEQLLYQHTSLIEPTWNLIVNTIVERLDWFTSARGPQY